MFCAGRRRTIPKHHANSLRGFNGVGLVCLIGIAGGAVLASTWLANAALTRDISSAIMPIVSSRARLIVDMFWSVHARWQVSRIHRRQVHRMTQLMAENVRRHI